MFYLKTKLRESTEKIQDLLAIIAVTSHEIRQTKGHFHRIQAYKGLQRRIYPLRLLLTFETI